MADDNEAAPAQAEPKPICGIIMPISAMPPTYTAAHWSDVRKVFDAAIGKAGMTPQIVSDSFESDVIQRRIISNLYDNPVVICDVSGLNPNVMFELGMRITFKQPVIIVTDDVASIPFDTKVIEHLPYPRDLHIHLTNEFIDKLSYRIRKLHEQKRDQTFKSFIEEFGNFEILEPTKKIVEPDQLILDRLESMERVLGRIARQAKHTSTGEVQGDIRFPLFTTTGKLSKVAYQKILIWLDNIAPEADTSVIDDGNGYAILMVSLDRYDKDSKKKLQDTIVRQFPPEYLHDLKLEFV